jgi:predicted dehydrogenase
MSEDVVRLGVVGLGWWGGALATAARTSGLAEVTACFARTKETREAFGDAHGATPCSSYRELLDTDIDGVLIATPHSTHGEVMRLAATAGKHIFVDKPFTLTVDDGERAIAAAEAAGVVLQVGHNQRRSPAMRHARELIDGGRLGLVQHFAAIHTIPVLFRELPPWRQRAAEIPAGAMTPLGIHQLDNFHYLGGPISRVSAFSKRLIDTPGELDDTTVINFEFASGATGSLFTSMISGPVTDVSVHGSEGSVWLRRDRPGVETQRRGELERMSVDLPELDTVADELAEFARAIRGGVKPETGGAEGLETVRVLEAIVASAAAHGAVTEVRR